MDNNEIFHRYREGDESAFTIIYDGESPRLYQLAYRMVGRIDEAEDIVAEMFAKLWERRREMTSMTHVLSYAYVMTRNACINCLRARRRTVSYDGRLVKDLSIIEAMPDHDPRTFAELMLAEHMFRMVLERIENELPDLPPQQQKVFSMLLSGSSVREISEALDLVISTVYNHRAAIFKKVREALEKEGLNASVLGLVLIIVLGLVWLLKNL